MDRRIDEIEKCQDGNRDTLMVHLKYGFCLFDQGCHTFGADDRREVKATMKMVKACTCGECK
jgi:hypothetical protein